MKAFVLLPLVICTGIPGFTKDLTPYDLYIMFEEKYNSIKDYQCRMLLISYNGNKFEKRINNYYFKKPRYIRMDILKGTRLLDNGSRGVFTGGDTVTGRKGIVSLTVDKTNYLVTTNRGYTFDESDIQYILEKFRFHLENSNITLNIHKNVFELIMVPRHPEKNKGITEEKIYLDSTTLLPVKAYSSVKSRLVQYVEWSHYIINAGLPEKLFNVWYNPEKLIEAGITTISEIPFTW